jgi:uncharacterized membrane protein
MNTFLVWIHLLAAISWIGGMMFLSLVLAPLFRRAGLSGERLLLFRDIARRFRVLVWLDMGLLVGTGVILIGQRGLSFSGVGAWPRPLQVKLALVFCLVALSLWHDLMLGAQARQTSEAPSAQRGSARWLARLIPRFALLLAVGVVFAAVVLVRS